VTGLTRVPSPQAWKPPASGGRDPAEGGAGALADRFDAVARFVRAAEPYLPAQLLDEARELGDRASQRLALPLTLTVVALAGATGGGKSSLFNALAGEELSPVGVRRPTTGEVHAAVFGPPETAVDLLDWLKVEPVRRFARLGAGAGDAAGLSGLVLLDLPDFDSVERGHAAEVERLLRLVDVVVWVVDPQKYADQVLHQRHLTRFGRYRGLTLVALNQADLLADPDLDRLLADLRDLLAADGLDTVPAITTSAVQPPSGTAPLRGWLEQVVAGRRAGLQRLSADLDVVVDDLWELVAPRVSGQALDSAIAGELSSGMAQVAAAPALIDSLESAYRSRAAVAMRPPLGQWFLRSRRRRPQPPADPPDGYRVPGPSGVLPGPAARSGVLPGPAARSAADLVVRRIAGRAVDRLPDPWPEAAAAAARADLDELLAGVGQAVGAAQLDLDRPPWWWRLFAAGQWMATAAVLLGLGWYAAGWVTSVVGLPADYPLAGAVPLPGLLILAGLAASVTLLVAGRQLARWYARRLVARVAVRLRATINEVGRSHVLAPLRAVLRAYVSARDALLAAGGR
jgi:hypothetical protein